MPVILPNFSKTLFSILFFNHQERTDSNDTCRHHATSLATSENHSRYFWHFVVLSPEALNPKHYLYIPRLHVITISTITTARTHQLAPNLACGRTNDASMYPETANFWHWKIQLVAPGEYARHFTKFLQNAIFNFIFQPSRTHGF